MTNVTRNLGIFSLRDLRVPHLTLVKLGDEIVYSGMKNKKNNGKTDVIALRRTHNTLETSGSWSPFESEHVGAMSGS